MAGSAVPAINWLMLRRGFHLALNGIDMTFAAQGDHGVLQKSLFFPCVGIMTRQTSLLGEQRRMYPVFGERIVVHIAVAPPAQLNSFPLGLERGSRGGFVVALIAHPGSNRLMHIIVEDARHVGSVRIMTAGTARRCHRIVHMLLGEDGPVRLMAFCAQCRDLILQEKLALGGGVRVMAVKAPLFHRVMLEFDLRKFLAHGLMTPKAEFIARFEEIELVVSRMRIVTFHALPCRNNLVRAARIGWNKVLVAGKADLGRITREQLFERRGVRVVTAGAVLFFQRGMDISFFHLLGEIRMTTNAEFAERPRLQFEFCRIVLRNRERTEQKQSHHSERGYDFIVNFHYNAPLLGYCLI